VDAGVDLGAMASSLEHVSRISQIIHSHYSDERLYVNDHHRAQSSTNQESRGMGRGTSSQTVRIHCHVKVR
jgi:hypothetical protein